MVCSGYCKINLKSCTRDWLLFHSQPFLLNSEIFLVIEWILSSKILPQQRNPAYGNQKYLNSFPCLSVLLVLVIHSFVLTPFLCTAPYVFLSSTLVLLRVKDFFFFSSFFTLSCLYNMLGLNEKPFCKNSSNLSYCIEILFQFLFTTCDQITLHCTH